MTSLVPVDGISQRGYDTGLRPSVTARWSAEVRFESKSEISRLEVKPRRHYVPDVSSEVVWGERVRSMCEMI